MKNILVTGAGALLGQGILRLLQISSIEKKIFTADPDPRSTGHWLGDCAITIPKANDVNYITDLEKIIKKNNIDVLLIGTDVELLILSKFKNDFLKRYNCKVVVSSEEVIKISNNKLLTAKFLENNNFPFPYSVMANDLQSLKEIENKFGFPLLAKPVDGARSIGIKKIDNHEELMSLYSPSSNMVVQEYLPLGEGEYTAGCVVINQKCKAITTLKRDLRDGNTYRAYRDENTSKYDKLIGEVAEKLNPDGPVNFQFRVYKGKPVIFEINGRFSGTTPLRYLYGFNEVEALLKNYLYEQEIEAPSLRTGIVLRTWSDVFVECSELQKLQNEDTLLSPKGKFFNFSPISSL